MTIMKRLHPKASTALMLSGLYSAAEALCSIFVSVYLWINSLDFNVVCMHYLALYATTPIFFIIAGRFAQSGDRTHVYRIGIALHAVYYGTLLLLRQSAPHYAVELGMLLGVAWGFFWAGANTINFDVTLEGSREVYIGLLAATNQFFRLTAPLLGALIIRYTPGKLSGYQNVFGAAMLIYVICVLLSFRMSPDNVRRPFQMKRALFPGKDQRDWRLAMAVSLTQAGAFNIFTFLLSLVMYMQTGNELSVGSFASFQALAAIATAAILARLIVPRTRKRFLFLGASILTLAGAIISIKLSLITLIVFGFMRSVSMPLFGVAHTGLRYDIIAKSVRAPHERIEYICAWEVPLALGRVIMMVTLMLLSGWLTDSSLGLRLTIFILCAARLISFYLLAQTDELKNPGKTEEQVQVELTT